MTPQFTSRYLPTKNEYEHRTCSRLSRAALFITGPEPERTQIPITRRLLDKLWYIHKHARFSAKMGATITDTCDNPDEPHKCYAKKPDMDECIRCKSTYTASLSGNTDTFWKKWEWAWAQGTTEKGPPVISQGMEMPPSWQESGSTGRCTFKTKLKRAVEKNEIMKHTRKMVHFIIYI